jgi:hypothetical protein
MRMAEVTTLYSWGKGKPEFPPPLEAESSSLADSSWMAWSDDDPLWSMPMNMMPESFPSSKTLVVKVVSDELGIFEADSLAFGELDAKQVDAISDDSGFRKNEPS